MPTVDQPLYEDYSYDRELRFEALQIAVEALKVVPGLAAQEGTYFIALEEIRDILEG